MDKIEPLLHFAFNMEINACPKDFSTLLFRDESVAVRLLNTYMHKQGMGFLQHCIRPLIQNITYYPQALEVRLIDCLNFGPYVLISICLHKNRSTQQEWRMQVRPDCTWKCSCASLRLSWITWRNPPACALCTSNDYLKYCNQLLH